MKKRKKILLGCPTFEGKEYCLDYWVKKVKEIQNKSKCDILVVDNSKNKRYYERIKNQYGLNVLKSRHYENEPLKSMTLARKKLFQYAIEKNYDYLFSLEQDLFPPKDIIEKLVNTRENIGKKEMVLGAPYILGRISENEPPYLTKDWLTNVGKEKKYNKRMRRKIQQNLKLREVKRKKKPFKAYNVAFGCTLIDCSILEKVKLDFTEKARRPDDAFFALECEKNDIPIYVDPSLSRKVIHIMGNTKSTRNWQNK